MTALHFLSVVMSFKPIFKRCVKALSPLLLARRRCDWCWPVRGPDIRHPTCVTACHGNVNPIWGALKYRRHGAEREACEAGRAVIRASVALCQACARTRPEAVGKLTLRALITRCSDLIVTPRHFYGCGWKKVSAPIPCRSAEGLGRVRVPAAASASHAPPLTFKRKYWLGFA